MKKIKITLLMLVVTSIVPGIAQAKASLHDTAEQIKLPYKHPDVLARELDTKLDELDKLPNPNLAIAATFIGGGITSGGVGLFQRGHSTIGAFGIVAGALLGLYGIKACERRTALLDDIHKDRLELEDVQKKEAARMQDIIAKLKKKIEEK